MVVLIEGLFEKEYSGNYEWEVFYLVLECIFFLFKDEFMKYFFSFVVVIDIYRGGFLELFFLEESVWREIF